MKKVKEGISDYAEKVDKDHEVQMARSQLYKLAEYSIKLHEMLKTLGETGELEAWQQAKITKASDYISSVYHALDYDMKTSIKNQPAMDIAMSAKEAKESSDPYKSKLHKSLQEKAKSKAQQRFMGMVHAAQKGEKPASKEVAKVAKNMKKSDAEDYAKTKHKGKPEHVKKKS